MMEMATKGHISDELRVIHQICQETERRKEKMDFGKNFQMWSGAKVF